MAIYLPLIKKKMHILSPLIAKPIAYHIVTACDQTEHWIPQITSSISSDSQRYSKATQSTAGQYEIRKADSNCVTQN